MKTLFILLLSCSAVFGQSFTFNDLPWLSAPSPNLSAPLSISGLQYWWVSSDMATNTAVLSWVDRISGMIRTNGDSSTRPTNSATGVGFAGNNYLSNSIYLQSSPTVLTRVWIFTPQAPTSFGAVDGSDDASGNGVLYTTSSHTLRPFAGGNTAFASYADGVNYMLAQRLTNGSANVVYFTNNVKITVIANTMSVAGHAKWVGRDGIADQYKGKLIEEFYYTNALTDDQITNTLYNYCRGTYPTLFP